jgi:hypothetical protein
LNKLKTNLKKVPEGVQKLRLGDANSNSQPKPRPESQTKIAGQTKIIQCGSKRGCMVMILDLECSGAVVYYSGAVVP